MLNYFIVKVCPRRRRTPITAEVTIENNDLDENPYTFTLEGTGQQGGAAR